LSKVGLQLAGPENFYSKQARVSLKDDGPTGQTMGQRGSDPSAYRVTITYYRVLNPKRLKKPGYYYHQMHTLQNTAPELQPSQSR